jgi:hypothetical protein
MRQSINLGNLYKIQTADFASYAFLILLPPIFFWRETLGWLALADADVIFWFFPVWRLAVEQLSNGQLPLWNPYLYSGTALFAQWQPGLLDPLNWIHLLGPTARTLTISQQASFIIALLGTFGFTRQLGMIRRASIVSAVIYALSGFVVARTIYPGLFHIYSLMPMALLLVERLYKRGRWIDVAFGGLIVAWQLLAAHPQPFIYSSLLILSYAIFCAFIRRDEKSHISNFRSQIFFLVQCAMIFVTGLLLSAVQLLPAWEVASQSVRQRVPYEFFTWHSIHPITLLTTLIPFFHGQGRSIFHLPYWGSYWHHNEAQLYLGIIAISLAISCTFCLWRERSRSILFWSSVGLMAFLLSLGKYMGPVAWLTYKIPLLNQFRSPNRHWMEVTMAVAVLSGYAVNHILSTEGELFARVTPRVAAGLTAVCAAAGVFVLWRKDQAEAVIRSLPEMEFLPRGFLQGAGIEFYLPAISAALILVVLILFFRTAHRLRWYLLLAALIVDFNLYSTFAPINNPLKLEAFLGKSMPPELIARQSERQPVRYHLMLNPDEGVFNPYWFYGQEMVTGYDPLLNDRYLTFSGINEAGRSTLSTLLDGRDRTLDLLNVDYVLIPAPVLDMTDVQGERVEYSGIAFSSDLSSHVDLRSGERANFRINAVAGDTLAVVSTMTNSVEVTDGDKMAEIAIGCDSGERAVAILRAGSDTAEWAYDRVDVRGNVHHSRAAVAASWPGDEAGSFQGHSYLARLRLPAGVARCGTNRLVQVTSRARGKVIVNIKQISLYDTGSGLSTPAVKTISSGLRDNSRWREIPVNSPELGYRDLLVFENLKALPRVWPVFHAEPVPDQDQLQLIRGEVMEGREIPFDPTQTALVDPADASKLDPVLFKPAEPAGESEAVSIIKREPDRMEISTEMNRPFLLVMSEVTFPGWRARIDGREVELLRINYLLRGLALTPGKHTVEVFYWPRSMILGAWISLAGVVLLMVLVIWERREIRNKRK